MIVYNFLTMIRLGLMLWLGLRLGSRFLLRLGLGGEKSIVVATPGSI